MIQPITHKKIRTPVRRDFAESYLLTSLVAFAFTVIATRIFLELTGYPQLGNDVLHIAHALWGGLLLTAAVLLPLAFANRWALQASALLGGVGIGLFIDEVGKFITQSNDYFFPPALALIYGFFLVLAFVYLHFRRPHERDPRHALYHVFEGLLDALDGDLDQEEAARIEEQLAVARSSGQRVLVNLADAIAAYLKEEKDYLESAIPSPWERFSARIGAAGHAIGRKAHRLVISLLMLIWAGSSAFTIAFLASASSSIDSQELEWRFVILLLQGVVFGLMAAAAFAWLGRLERRGIQFAESALLVSLVALQTIEFYISQFSALGAVLLQVGFLLVLQAYRRWYLQGARNS